MPSCRPHTVQVLLAAVSLMALGIAISTTDLRARLAAGVGELDRADPAQLVGAALAFAFALLCCGLAWHAGLKAAGVSTSRRDAMSRYVAGSLVNSLLPLRAGGAVSHHELASTLAFQTRSGVIGSCRTGVPITFAIAFAIAPAVATHGGSPTPLEPFGPAFSVGVSTQAISTSGASALVTSL
jgi:uncharacterized membrane protein YbhN (UPF0104 family)